MRRAREPHRTARVQPDVRDICGCGAVRFRQGLPPTRDRAGHLRQLHERARHQPREAALRHRPDGQELPQRDQPAQLHVPLARVRADGDRVLLPRTRPRWSGTSSGGTRVTSGTSTSGCKSEKLRLRDQTADELAHYSKACADIEYLFPFSDEHQELEGVAHRGCYDLEQHSQAQRQGPDLLRRRPLATGRRQVQRRQESRQGSQEQGPLPLPADGDRALGRRRPRRAGVPVRGLHGGRSPRTTRAAWNRAR